MEEDSEIVRVGEMACFTCGEYSDYRVLMIGVALKEFSYTSLKAAHKGGGEFWDVVKWIIEQGYVEELPMCEVHLGSYEPWDEE